MISPVKILLLLAVIAAVVVGARFFRKIGSEEAENPRKSGKKKSRGDNVAAELVKCPDCGTYVASLEEHNCKS